MKTLLKYLVDHKDLKIDDNIDAENTTKNI